jgi:hypothetical protein
MTEKSRSEFILEIVKTLIWPALIILAVFWLGSDLKEMLKSRTWKIGIIEVGDRITTLKDTMQSEFLLQKDYLDKILSNYKDPGKVQEYANKALISIENAQKGVKKDIQTIQENIPITLPVAVSQKKTNGNKPNTAQGCEALGFKYLMEKEIDPAIEAFSESERIWPDYHNVAEIRRLLTERRETLKTKDSHQWKLLYQIILKQFSWGIPSEVRQQMQKDIVHP